MLKEDALKAMEQRDFDIARIKLKQILEVKASDPKVKEMIASLASIRDDNGHEWVDMGLSVKWATCNLGAHRPEDPGDLFAWGEVASKSVKEFNFRDYQWASSFLCEDWGGIGTNDVLYYSNDAAHQIWGGTWRIPTHEEILELYEEGTWVWTKRGQMTGYLVTSKKMGHKSSCRQQVMLMRESIGKKTNRLLLVVFFSGQMRRLKTMES